MNTFLVENDELIHKALHAMEKAGITRPGSWGITSRTTVTFWGKGGQPIGKLSIRFTRNGRKLFFVHEQEIPFDF